MALNIIESLKERRNFDRTTDTAHIHLERKEGGPSLSATLKDLSPSGLICFSNVDLNHGDFVTVRIPHINGLFEAGAKVLKVKKLFRAYELKLKFFEIRRDIPSF